jgi:hypothetical protein
MLRPTTFFTGFDIAQFLLLKKLTLLGTVRKSRTELPIQLLLKKREQYESIFMFTENTLLVSYAPQQNRTVILMSTMHDQPEVDTVNEERKPFAVLDYNSTKGAVDSFDQQIGYYSCARKTNRWPMRLFYFIIDAASFNSSVIFRMSNDAWKENEGRRRDQRRLFLLTLGEQMVMPAIQNRAVNSMICNRPQLSRAFTSVGVMPTGSCGKAGSSDGSRKRGRCIHCPRQKEQNVSVRCSRCQMFVCGQTSTKMSTCNQCPSTAAAYGDD